MWEDSGPRPSEFIVHEAIAEKGFWRGERSWRIKVVAIRVNNTLDTSEKKVISGYAVHSVNRLFEFDSSLDADECAEWLVGRKIDHSFGLLER